VKTPSRATASCAHIRWMPGQLHHFSPAMRSPFADMPELSGYSASARRADAIVREAYADFELHDLVASLAAFSDTEMSAFYFDRPARTRCIATRRRPAPLRRPALTAAT